MTDQTRIADMPPLSIDDREIAGFRARDGLWAAVGDLFDRYREEQGLSFACLGRRIGRSRAQVQRWLTAPGNMTLYSAGLLAEGLDADLHLELKPRAAVHYGANYTHPCEAAADLVRVTMDESLSTRLLPVMGMGHASSPASTSAPKADFTLHLTNA